MALVIEADSLDTGNRRRDDHLRSAAFFDAADYPWVRFEADAVDGSDRCDRACACGCRCRC